MRAVRFTKGLDDCIIMKRRMEFWSVKISVWDYYKFYFLRLFRRNLLIYVKPLMTCMKQMQSLGVLQ